MTAELLQHIAQGEEYVRGPIPDYDDPERLDVAPSEPTHYFGPPRGADRLPTEE